MYACIGLAMLWQYRYRDFRVAGDLHFVLGFVSEARNALKQGQFPIRVAPQQWGQMQYPVFQYYGNFPFTVTGEIARWTGGNPYTAWKIAALLTFICDGIFAERLAYLLTRRRGPAVIAAIAFLLAPYQFADLNARGAFTEMVAMNLLPAAIYFSIRAFASYRWRYIIACALSWTIIGLTHNVTYLHGVIFVGGWLLSYPAEVAKYLRRAGRLVGAGALHAALILWYFVPQVLTLKLLAISAFPLSPYEFTDLTPLRVLLSPVLTTTPASASAEGLGLQIGWPILAGFIVATIVMALRGSLFGRRGTAVRLAGLYLLAGFLAWSPFDFWKHLPHVFWFVQFPYRFLMFSSLFGAILLAMGLSAWFPRGLSPPAAFFAVAGILACAIPFLPPAPQQFYPKYARSQMLNPDIGAAPRDAYLLSQPAAADGSLTDLHPGFAEWEHAAGSIGSQHKAPGLPPEITLAAADWRRVWHHRVARLNYTATTEVILEFPALYYPGMLDIRDHGQRIAYGHAGHFLALRVGPGTHHLRVRYVGVRWANYVSAGAWAAVVVGAFAAAFRWLLVINWRGKFSRNQLERHRTSV